MAVTADPLAEVRESATPGTFPPYLLGDCSSALLLFCSGFHGRYDGVHVADAGIREVTAVDYDERTLDEMRPLYPPEWEFTCADAYKYPVRELAWDLVCADPPSEHCFRAPSYLQNWAPGARRWVVLGVMGTWFEWMNEPVALESMPAPEGFVAHDLRRRNPDMGGVYWIVFKREAWA